MSDNESDLYEDSVFDSNCETSDNISIGSSSGAVLVKYVKISWVWKYFEVSKDGMYNICKVETLNLSNEK
ncbi:9698_t:CDS:2, partial [Racocetra persica]